VNIQPRSAQGYSGFRAAGDSTANSNVLPRRDKSKPFTERSKVSKVFVNRGEGYNPYFPIFSKTVVYSDGKTMEIFNLISIDNPNTEKIEKGGWPAQQQNNPIQNTATHANNPKGKLKLGSGYGKPTIRQGAWDVNGKNFIGGSLPKTAKGDARSGYYWDPTPYQKYQADIGYGIAAWIQVPIVNPNGDLSYSFHPNAEYKRGAWNSDFKELFENVYLKGKDPYYEWLKSPEVSASLSQSTSKVQASESRSRSIVQSIEDSRSQSISDSESRVKSQSVSTSESISTAKSKSISTSESIVKSESESTAKSRSISTSQ
ncbi:hypothetical protein, partial [Staphylococcus delphini]